MKRYENKIEKMPGQAHVKKYSAKEGSNWQYRNLANFNHDVSPKLRNVAKLLRICVLPFWDQYCNTIFAIKLQQDFDALGQMFSEF